LVLAWAIESSSKEHSIGEPVMIRPMTFLVLTSLAAICGLVFTLKYFGWPSVAERKNKVVRAIKAGFSTTVFTISLIFMYFYWTTPGEFFNQWTLVTVLGALFFLVIPIFFLITIGAFIQFSVWEKTNSIMMDKLKKIVDDSRKESNKN
jgi:hypothetical protein